MKSKQDEASLESEVVSHVASHLGDIAPSFTTKDRPDGRYLLFEAANPSERLYRVAEQVSQELPETHPLKDRISVVPRRKRPANLLEIPETRLLQRTISESLTVDRNTFGDEFFTRYTSSVTNLEAQVVSSANFVVYGRRGAGKSSLLAYAMHKLQQQSLPFAWVAMQTYASRGDEAVIASVLVDILEEIRASHSGAVLSEILAKLKNLSQAEGPTLQKIQRILPDVRRFFSTISAPGRPLTIFLDDFHVISSDVQPKLLAAIYAAARGNNTYIKLSGIEQLTRTWDIATRIGLETPHDAQILKLDYNLTMPDKSQEHIVGILDAHARYASLPNINYLASDKVLSRLVLVAAAVPRDALGLFSQAISKAVVRGQRSVSITSINAAASEMAEEKLRDVEKDTSTELQTVTNMVDRLKSFCISQHRKNAFLVQIRNSNPDYQLIQKLIALRLVHVLHEGVTPHKAGQRFVALMLDYGFYVGIRAAKSVELFPTEPRPLLAKELRRLPIFETQAQRIAV